MTITKEMRTEMLGNAEAYADNASLVVSVLACQLKQALDALEESEAKAPRWISTAERLPTEFETVLFSSCWGSTDGSIIGYRRGERFHGEGDAWKIGTPDVTHWMPLPRAPEPPAQETQK